MAKKKEELEKAKVGEAQLEQASEVHAEPEHKETVVEKVLHAIGIETSKHDEKSHESEAKADAKEKPVNAHGAVDSQVQSKFSKFSN